MSSRTATQLVLPMSTLPPLVSIPDDPTYVYPLSSFPPMSSFDVSMEFPALIVPTERTNELRKKFKTTMLHRPGMRVVVPLSDEESTVPNHHPATGETTKTEGPNQSHDGYRKLVLGLTPTQLDDELRKVSGNEGDGDAHSEKNDEMVLLKSLLDKGEVHLGHHIIRLTYDDWTAEDVLRRLLPVREIPSSFEVVGRLAHINLRDDLLPYKYLIGKVLLDKNTPRIRTVVNKVGTIETEYRTFGMEVIAGDAHDGWSIVSVKEEGCIYQLDFQKVYWNSRLGGEHRRLVAAIWKSVASGKEGRPDVTVVADLMAGIGPFAIPLTATTKATNASTATAATRPIHVYANDLNPASYQYLVINAKKNKCQHLKTYNQDARAFCHSLQDQGIYPDHFIMNLPATALEFLDAFRGYTFDGPDGSDAAATTTVATSSSSSSSSSVRPPPWIHVHCFAPKNPTDAEREIWQRCETALGCTLDKETDHVSIHLVRDVAPNKNMYCVSFRLPRAVQELSRLVLLDRTTSSSLPSTLHDEADQSRTHKDDSDRTTKRPKLAPLSA